MSKERLYITKYALTEGIRLEECDISPKFSSMATPHGRIMSYHGEGKEWHRTFESAQKQAYAMRDAKIKSLEKALKKMKAMNFETPPDQ